MPLREVVEKLAIQAIHEARTKVRAQIRTAKRPDPDQATPEERASDLDDFVFQYCFAFESTFGGIEQRTDELRDARTLLGKLTERRGWFATNNDADAATVLGEALALITKEHAERTRRWQAGRGPSASTLERLFYQLAHPGGRGAPWREDFALSVGDAIGAWDPQRRRRDVDLPSVLAKIEAVVWCRHPEVLERAGIAESAVYVPSDTACTRRATDRWRKTLKRLEVAIAKAPHSQASRRNADSG